MPHGPPIGSHPRFHHGAVATPSAAGQLAEFDYRAKRIFHQHGIDGESLHVCTNSSKSIINNSTRNKIQKYNNAYRVIRHLDQKSMDELLVMLEEELVAAAPFDGSQAFNNNLDASQTCCVSPSPVSNQSGPEAVSHESQAQDILTKLSEEISQLRDSIQELQNKSFICDEQSDSQSSAPSDLNVRNTDASMVHEASDALTFTALGANAESILSDSGTSVAPFGWEDVLTATHLAADPFIRVVFLFAFHFFVNVAWLTFVFGLTALIPLLPTVHSLFRLGLRRTYEDFVSELGVFAPLTAEDVERRLQQFRNYLERIADYLENKDSLQVTSPTIPTSS